MQIETERLLIRDFIEDDFDAVYAYSSDPEGVRYMAFPPSTPENTREYIDHCTPALMPLFFRNGLHLPTGKVHLRNGCIHNLQTVDVKGYKE